ncbi:hypothetical protein SALBM135S_06082 [Streptomyces alboniger]
MALQLETVESPMYANVITRQNGSSSLKATPPPFATAVPSRGPFLSASTYQRLPASAAGSSTATAGRYDTNSDRSQCAPAHASEAPAIPPKLYAAWKPSMMLRPYACCKLTPSMFIDASSAPTASPNAPRANATCHSSSPAPTPRSASSTTGCDHLSTPLGGTLLTSFSVPTLPTPARMGTAARKTGSSPSDIPYRSWIAGIRVTSRAKATP